MSKPKVLLVGEHPLGVSGNGGMMHSFVSDLDHEKYDVSCVVVGYPADLPTILFKKVPIAINSISNENDFWGYTTLLDIINRAQFEVCIFVGIDCWRYIEAMPDIFRIRDRKGFKLGALFPYDLSYIRKEMVDVIGQFDCPTIYSEYAFEMLSNQIKHLSYFRPPLHLSEIWKPYPKGHVEKIRRRLFHGTGIPEDTFMIGFVGNNQYRKDPQKLVKAFKIFSDKYPNSVLYMHTEKNDGVFNIPQYAIDCGIKPTSLLLKPDKKRYPLSQMPDVYNSMDLYVNCSMQEGLSWTVIESMLCGTPPLISETTAHKDLYFDTSFLVPCETECLIPIKSRSGQTWVEAHCCDARDIANAIESYYLLPEEEKEYMKRCTREAGERWLSGVGNPNDLVERMLVKKPIPVKRSKDAVLFAQHSAAGDVFMTTRCFKGIKERHPDTPFHYMTQAKFHDIIKGNPYIDEILDWNNGLLDEKEYRFIYNPHGEVILPGHWGRNCNSILADFYWKILKVKPDHFFIQTKDPGIKKIKGRFAVLHTTGGDPHFRTYKYMGDVAQGLRKRDYMSIQLGGKNDYPAGADIDLRGKLSYRESAWIMERASIAVTVDSFMSHLAGAFGVDQVVLFGSGNYIVVQPWTMHGSKLICMSPDYVEFCKGLGPCSASIRDCPIPCTGIHDPQDILKAIDERIIE